MDGPRIIVRSLSVVGDSFDKYGNRWQYHSRSDRHSKISCWCVLFDLLQESALLRRHVQSSKVVFGVNRELTDFRYSQKKNLDLVIAQPGAADVRGYAGKMSFKQLAPFWGIVLDDDEAVRLDRLPDARVGSTGMVLAALEAKATMTAHQRALPRLYAELDSSHSTVHGSNINSAVGGLVMVNGAPEFISPDSNKFDLDAQLPNVNHHQQPRDAALVVEKIRNAIPRSAGPGDPGFDAIGIIVVDARNDGSPIRLHEGTPSPPAGDAFTYQQLIARLQSIYDARQANL